MGSIVIGIRGDSNTVSIKSSVDITTPLLITQVDIMEFNEGNLDNLYMGNSLKIKLSNKDNSGGIISNDKTIINLFGIITEPSSLISNNSISREWNRNGSVIDPSGTNINYTLTRQDEGSNITITISNSEDSITSSTSHTIQTWDWDTNNWNVNSGNSIIGYFKFADPPSPPALPPNEDYDNIINSIIIKVLDYVQVEILNQGMFHIAPLSHINGKLMGQIFQMRLVIPINYKKLLLVQKLV